jgi:hypothetical protein
MKNIKDLTEQDCIHCATQEEFNAVLAMLNNENGITSNDWGLNKENSYLKVNVYSQAVYADLDYARHRGYTIHPASDFLTPQVSVLTEIGDCKVIKNGGDVIVMTGNVVITLTPPVLKHIQELLNQQQ